MAVGDTGGLLGPQVPARGCVRVECSVGAASWRQRRCWKVWAGWSWSTGAVRWMPEKLAEGAGELELVHRKGPSGVPEKLGEERGPWSSRRWPLCRRTRPTTRKRRLFLCCARSVCVCAPAEEMIHTQVQRWGSEQAAQGLKEPGGGNGVADPPATPRGARRARESARQACRQTPAVSLASRSLGLPGSEGEEGTCLWACVHARMCVHAHAHVCTELLFPFSIFLSTRKNFREPLHPSRGGTRRATCARAHAHARTRVRARTHRSLGARSADRT